MKTKFSVIIPAYNAGKTIGKCLDSILASKRDDVEVIIVDDKSIDDTASIIYEYSKMYSNIKFVNLDCNGGVSNARNIGISYAKGAFLCFVDSDDYVSDKYFDSIDIMLSEMIDIAIFSNYIVKKNGEIIGQEQKYTTEVFLNKDSIFQIAMERCSEGPWNKVYRKDFIIENNILFNNKLKLWEDLCFFVTAVGKAKSVKAFSDRIYYYAHVNEMSATSISKFRIDDFFQMVDYCWSCISGNKLAERNLSNFAINYLYEKIIKSKIITNDSFFKIRKNETVKKMLCVSNSNIKTNVKRIILKVKIYI